MTSILSGDKPEPESYALLTSGKESSPKSLKRELQGYKKYPGELDKLAKEIESVTRQLINISPSETAKIDNIEKQYQELSKSFSLHSLKNLQIHNFCTQIVATGQKQPGEEDSENTPLLSASTQSPSVTDDSSFPVDEQKSSSIALSTPTKKIFEEMSTLQFKIDHNYLHAQLTLITLEDKIKNKRAQATTL